MFNKNFSDDGIQNRGPLVSEATALPTEPQPLPFLFKKFIQAKIVAIYRGRPTGLDRTAGSLACCCCYSLLKKVQSKQSDDEPRERERERERESQQQ